MKKQRRATFLIAMLCLISTSTMCQIPFEDGSGDDSHVEDSVMFSKELEIVTEIINVDSNKYRFKIEGFPKGFKSLDFNEENTFFFWSFGDGTYSREFEPKHKYLVQGEYEVQFRAESRYTPAGDLAEKTAKLKVPKAKHVANTTRRSQPALKIENLMPVVPEAHMPMHLEYANTMFKNKPINGKLWFFYNPKEHVPMFKFKNLKLNNGELSRLPSNSLNQLLYSNPELQILKETFTDYRVIEFKNLSWKEKRYLNFELFPSKLIDSMYTDTARVLIVMTLDTNRAVQIVRQKELEMDIRRSRDPNDLKLIIGMRSGFSSSAGGFTGKVFFENVGDEMVRTVDIIVTPSSSFNLESFQIINGSQNLSSEDLGDRPYWKQVKKKDGLFHIRIFNLRLCGKQSPKECWKCNSNHGWIKFKVKANWRLVANKKQAKAKLCATVVFDGRDSLKTKSRMATITSSRAFLRYGGLLANQNSSGPVLTRNWITNNSISLGKELIHDKIGFSRGFEFSVKFKYNFSSQNEISVRNLIVPLARYCPNSSITLSAGPVLAIPIYVQREDKNAILSFNLLSEIDRLISSSSLPFKNSMSFIEAGWAGAIIDLRIRFDLIIKGSIGLRSELNLLDLLSANPMQIANRNLGFYIEGRFGKTNKKALKNILNQ